MNAQISWKILTHTIVEFRFVIENVIIIIMVLCGVLVTRIIVPSEQEQEQSSLYIVQNKFLISSSDSVETAEASDLFIKPSAILTVFQRWRCIKS